MGGLWLVFCFVVLRWFCFIHRVLICIWWGCRTLPAIWVPARHSCILRFRPISRDGIIDGICRENRGQSGSSARGHYLCHHLRAGVNALLPGPGQYLFLTGRFIQGVGAGGCYVVAFAILRDTLSAQRRAKVLSMLNGITCIIPVMAPVVGYLIMLKFPWQSLFWTMAAMGALVFILSITVLKETHPARKTQAIRQPFIRPRRC